MHRRIAIVGAGPSGLFAAQALVAAEAPGLELSVDLIDRLPTPYGLLRYGVAPDHTSIKSVANALARTFESERVRFLGTVDFGTDVTREELLASYDAVIYAVGASEDLRMNIPGEDMAGSISAREFVAWYGGHPDARPQILDGVTSVATIGVGNVAVDVARVLVKDPHDLHVTDMPQAVLDTLAEHTVTEVHVVGRRGPQHASFTSKELRELVNLDGVQVAIDPGAFDGIDLDELDRRTKTNVTVLQEAETRQVDNPRARLVFHFWARPVEVLHAEDDSVNGLVLERTTLDDNGRVAGTGATFAIAVQRVLRAIGYRSVPLPGVPFDDRAGIVPNIEGRVVDAEGTVQPREYVAGWIKRGPVGVIGTNKSDAAQTVGHLLADLADQPATERPSLDDVFAARGFRASTFADWQVIDAAEISLGESRDRERTKIEGWAQLLDLIRAEQDANA
ncbi:FAD-dependent oxidoreductase [Enemella sp. A6]|uniref:FAD-dependent oxidoreductase n=1 Tax=Enemella sp. A6 TaxID=3440152 RepID=UPI003EB9B6B3